MLKECNYLWGASDQILLDTDPTKRGFPAANGVPSAVNVPDSDVKETSFKDVIGAKQIPEVPIQGGRVVYHNKMALGLGSLREGLSISIPLKILRRYFR